MKLSRPVVIPALLVIYLAVMAVVGLKGLESGQTPLWQYAATIVVTLGIIILLHFHLKKRERLRQQRLQDIEQSKKQHNG